MKRTPKHAHTVLLVEDDALNLELLQTVLEASGFTVLAASDARTGLELARAERPDIVLMDVQLPEMDGLEATRALRSDPRTAAIPVVAVTAHVKKDDEERCRAAGCVLHLPKPVDTRALPGLVAQIIEEAQAAVVPGVVAPGAARPDAAEHGAPAPDPRKVR